MLRIALGDVTTVRTLRSRRTNSAIDHAYGDGLYTEGDEDDVSYLIRSAPRVRLFPI